MRCTACANWKAPNASARASERTALPRDIGWRQAPRHRGGADDTGRGVGRGVDWLVRLAVTGGVRGGSGHGSTYVVRPGALTPVATFGYIASRTERGSASNARDNRSSRR